MKLKISMNKLLVFAVLLFISLYSSGCMGSKENFKTDDLSSFRFSVSAELETDPVYKDPDDTATWVNPEDPEKSLILATDKGYGLLVFNIKGKLVKSFKDGHLNNRHKKRF